MTEHDYDKLLDTSIEALPKEVKPPRDLWAGIDHAIEMRGHEKKIQSSRILQVAAVLTLVIGINWFVFTGLSVDTSASNEISRTMLAEDIDKSFKSQKENILAIYEGKPALTANWKEQLRELEVARSSVWTELKKNPDNAYMIQILLEVQQQQLDLIQSVHSTLNQDI